MLGYVASPVMHLANLTLPYRTCSDIPKTRAHFLIGISTWRWGHDEIWRRLVVAGIFSTSHAMRLERRKEGREEGWEAFMHTIPSTATVEPV